MPVARNIEYWMSRLAAPQRAALEKLRAQIRAAARGAEEVISYGQPTYLLHGHLVAFGAFKNHLSFFPMNAKVIAAHVDDFDGFATSKGTIQFTPEKPIPAALVRKIVKARIAQNLEVADERKRRKAAAAKTKPKATRARSA